MSSSVEQSVLVERLLQELRAQDIRIWAEGGDLRVSAPQGALTADLREALSQRKPELLAFLISGGGERTAEAVVPLVSVDRERELPLSFAQERMWVLHQLAPTDSVYIVRNTSFLRAKVAMVQRAWNALLERHEILRTTYRMKDDGRLDASRSRDTARRTASRRSEPRCGCRSGAESAGSRARISRACHSTWRRGRCGGFWYFNCAMVCFVF